MISKQQQKRKKIRASKSKLKSQTHRESKSIHHRDRRQQKKIFTNQRANIINKRYPRPRPRAHIQLMNRHNKFSFFSFPQREGSIDNLPYRQTEYIYMSLHLMRRRRYKPATKDVRTGTAVTVYNKIN